MSIKCSNNVCIFMRAILKQVIISFWNFETLQTIMVYIPEYWDLLKYLSSESSYVFALSKHIQTCKQENTYATLWKLYALA